jgi:hypothetical protein
MQHLRMRRLCANVRTFCTQPCSDVNAIQVMRMGAALHELDVHQQYCDEIDNEIAAYVKSCILSAYNQHCSSFERFFNSSTINQSVYRALTTEDLMLIQTQVSQIYTDCFPLLSLCKDDAMRNVMSRYQHVIDRQVTIQTRVIGLELQHNFLQCMRTYVYNMSRRNIETVEVMAYFETCRKLFKLFVVVWSAVPHATVATPRDLRLCLYNWLLRNRSLCVEMNEILQVRPIVSAIIGKKMCNVVT